MNKKRIMYSIFTINIIFIVYLFNVIHKTNCINQITSNLQAVRISIPENKSIESSVSFLINNSKNLDTQLIYEYANQGKGFTYYTTSMSEKDNTLSSYPQKNEKRLDGFYDKYFIIKKKSFDKIVFDDIYSLSGTFYVDPSKVENLRTEFSQYDINIEIENRSKLDEHANYFDLYILFFVLFYFYIVSVLFYVFSRSREYAVCKSSGFSNYQNMKKELKNNWIIYLYIFICILILSFSFFTILHGLTSSFTFIRIYIISFIVSFILFLIPLAVSSYYVSFICGIAELKGKANNGKLLLASEIMKIVIIIFLMMIVAETITDGYRCYQSYNNIRNSISILKEYGRTEFYDGSIALAGEESSKNYIDSMLKFYMLMDKRKHVIFADLQSAEHNKQYYGSDLLGTGFVNSNYLNDFTTIYKLDGNNLTSDDLSKEKCNILIPENMDMDNLPESCLFDNKSVGCEINYIKYSNKSRFFTFNDDPETLNDGYTDNIIIEIVNPEQLVKYLPSDMAFDDIVSFFGGKAFFKHSSESNQTPDEQIKEILLEAGLFADTFSAEKAEINLYEIFTMIKENLFIMIISSIILFWALIFLCLNTTLLYYQNQKKNIFIKLINGYSFIEIFSLPMTIKLFQMLLIVLCGYLLYRISYIPLTSILLSSCLCIIIDYVLFYIYIRYYLKKGVRRDVYE